MHESRGVELLERPADGADETQGFLPGAWLAGNEGLLQGHTRDVLLDDEKGASRGVLAAVVDRHEAGVRKLRRAPRLLEQPRLEGSALLGRRVRRQQHGFHHDDPVEHGVARLVRHRRGPAPDLLLDLVASHGARERGSVHGSDVRTAWYDGP